MEARNGGQRGGDAGDANQPEDVWLKIRAAGAGKGARAATAPGAARRERPEMFRAWCADPLHGCAAGRAGYHLLRSRNGGVPHMLPTNEAFEKFEVLSWI